MGYFDKFRSQPKPQQQQQPQGQQGQGPQQQNPSQQDPNQQRQSMLPGNGSNATGNPDQPLDPLDAYQGLYNNTDDANDKVPVFELNQDQLGVVTKSQSFMKDVDPALMTRLQSGDMTALSDIIEHATRNSYRASLEHSSKLTDKYVGARFDYEGKGLGGKIRDNLVTGNLSKIPGFSHPVAQQELVKVAKSLAKQHPDASPEEIADEARRYLTELGRSLDPNTQQQADRKKASETDWDEYMNS